MKIFLSLLCALFLFAVSSVSARADGSCLAINNGGVTNQQFCPTPTPTPAQSNTPAGTNQQQNNGRPVYPPQQTKTTPNTGPADWALPALILLAGVGLLLRNKTNRLLT